jgi:hypothetical protein
MPAGYNDSADSQYSMMSTDMKAGMYDGGTSSESSASSPLNVSIENALVLYVKLTFSSGLREYVCWKPIYAISCIPNAIPDEWRLSCANGVDTS